MTSGSAEAAIVADHLVKIYRVFASPVERLKRFFGRRGRYLDFAALDDVTFAVRPGEAVGVIGENGAGKSTLLKILTGTTAPTSGEVRTEGTVASILELGAAFHPEFSGRENAVLYGALLGLDRRTVDERLDEILAFAELGDFIDHPVKSYSTGMAMRLAFAVATHLDPDILVIDEALAVGDGYFQKKCVDRLVEIKRAGVTILFCSHSMYYVTTFCDRALWLRDGRLVRDGDVGDVVPAYEEHLLSRQKRRPETDDGEADGLPPGKQAVIRSIRVLDASGVETDTYRPGDDLVIRVEWESRAADAVFHVGVALERRDGSRVVGVGTFWDGVQPPRGAGRHAVSVRLLGLPVAQGVYSVAAYLFDESGLHVYDQAALRDRLEPAETGWKAGLVDVRRTWEV